MFELLFQKFTYLCKKYSRMSKVIEYPPIILKSGSPLGEGLKKMVEHKKLREQFLMGEITFEELNRLLIQKGINKQYDHPRAVHF